MKYNTKDNEENKSIELSVPDSLYSVAFDNDSKRFFYVVQQEQGFNIKLAPKTKMEVVFHKNSNDIEGLTLIKLIDGNEKQKISFSTFNIAQLKAFLKLISDIDLGDISERKLTLSESSDLDVKTISKIRTVLMNDGGLDVIQDLLDEGLFDSKDLVNTAYRRKALRMFKSMLNDNEHYKVYAKVEGIDDSKEEKVWQYFFEQNEWIFGYGLDYRFQSILQREASLSNTDLDGKNEVTTDFLLGDKKFTTFVEIKKPTTQLYTKSKNRSKSWKLSSELFESVSQILEQKASGLLKLDKAHFNKEGQLIKQKAYDSKVILLVGHWNQISDDNDRDKEIKKKTFELFRRDSRNIEILTYDELYERANFIVNDSSE